LTSSGSSNSTTFRRLHRPQCATMKIDIGAIAHGFHLLKGDRGVWLAVGPEFVDLVRSPAGFGTTRKEAVREHRAQLRKAGYPDRSLPRLSDFTVHGE
jgi:hypothetical protein